MKLFVTQARMKNQTTIITRKFRNSCFHKKTTRKLNSKLKYFNIVEKLHSSINLRTFLKFKKKLK